MDENAAVSPETDATTQDDVTAADLSTEESAVVDTPVVDEVVVDDTVVTEPVITDEVIDTPVEDEPVVTEDEEPSFATIEDAVKAVKDLRKENARRRSLNKDIDSAFGNSDEGFREGWIELARMLNGSEEEQAEAVSVLSRYVNGESEADVDSTDEIDPARTEAAIIEKVGRVFEEREQQLAVKAEQAKIAIEVEQLGYKADSDPSTPEFAAHALLWQLVAAQPEGQKDLKAAHAQVEAYEVAVLNRQLDKLKNANTGLPQRISGVTTGAASSVESTEPVSARDAIKQAELESIRRAEERKSAPRF